MRRGGSLVWINLAGDLIGSHRSRRRLCGWQSQPTHNARRVTNSRRTAAQSRFRGWGRPVPARAWAPVCSLVEADSIESGHCSRGIGPSLHWAGALRRRAPRAGLLVGAPAGLRGLDADLLPTLRTRLPVRSTRKTLSDSLSGGPLDALPFARDRIGRTASAHAGRDRTGSCSPRQRA